MFHVDKIADGFYWLKGKMPENALLEPDVANAFIIEQNDDVYLIDTGVGPQFKQALLDFFRTKSYRNATLITTHWHVDHVCNNDVLEQIQADSRHHMLHPKGMEYLNMFQSVIAEALETLNDYFPADFSHSPLVGLNVVGKRLSKIMPEILFKLVATRIFKKFQPVNNKTAYIEPLSSSDKHSFMIGSVKLEGWSVGNLILVDDQAHSPDSLVIYDTHRKLLLPADLVYQYNPLWRSGTYQRTIDNLKVYRTMVEEGFIEILGDSHNHHIFYGADTIMQFLNDLIATHEQRRKAILDVMTIKGLYEVESIHDALRDTNEFKALLKQKEFPMAYLCTRAMIAVAISEELKKK